MPVSDIPILAMLRSRMAWHQERQRVLADNVANADTPKFKPRDLVPPDIGRTAPAAGPVARVRTDALDLSAPGAGGSQSADGRCQYQARPTGNAMSLEEEMMK